VTLVVQVATPGSPTASFPSAVTPGNTVVAIVAQRDFSTSGPTWPTGFDLMGSALANISGNNRRVSMAKYVVQSDTTLLTVGADSKTFQSSVGLGSPIAYRSRGRGRRDYRVGHVRQYDRRP
jgi:hypothetical protein